MTPSAIPVVLKDREPATSITTNLHRAHRVVSHPRAFHRGPMTFPFVIIEAHAFSLVVTVLAEDGITDRLLANDNSSGTDTGIILVALLFQITTAAELPVLVVVFASPCSAILENQDMRRPRIGEHSPVVGSDLPACWNRTGIIT